MFESRKERCGEGEILKEKNRNGGGKEIPEGRLLYNTIKATLIFVINIFKRRKRKGKAFNIRSFCRGDNFA